MVSKKVRDEAIDHAVITMRNVRKLSPVRQQSLSYQDSHHEIIWLVLG
jgi:hypothetical protein